MCCALFQLPLEVQQNNRISALGQPLLVPSEGGHPEPQISSSRQSCLSQVMSLERLKDWTLPSAVEPLHFSSLRDIASLLLSSHPGLSAFTTLCAPTPPPSCFLSLYPQTGSWGGAGQGETGKSAKKCFAHGYFHPCTVLSIRIKRTLGNHLTQLPRSCTSSRPGIPGRQQESLCLQILWYKEFITL